MCRNISEQESEDSAVLENRGGGPQAEDVQPPI